MLGQMQDQALLVTMFLSHGARHHGDSELISVTVHEGVHRTTYRECEARARRVASALERYGIKRGDRVATLGWNSYRHFEAWYAVSGMGAVTHTVNPRLFQEQIVYILNHAEDRLIFADVCFLPLLEAIWPELRSVEAVVLFSNPETMPKTTLPNVLSYETFLAGGDAGYVWPTFDERTAAGLCYTSGTTGNPKGVLFSHRSLVLHTYGVGLTDTFGLGAMDCVLAVVPMFHANAWGLPYLAPAVGAKLVFPGANLTGAALTQLIHDEEVTCAAGVPTVWLGLLQHIERLGQNFGSLNKVVIGGSAAPRSMVEAFEHKYDIRVRHAWGMTELSPLGTCSVPKRETLGRDAAGQIDIACKQGRAVVGIDLKITGDAGQELPWDGQAFGNLKVRGPWVVREYFRGEGGAILDADGWFDTGDVATIDPEGFVQITDRAKDVIKSGGEWISSIELENAAVAHPHVAEAAVIGVAHPKWGERPLLIVVLKPDVVFDRDELLTFLSGKVARWWLPDDVVVVEELPHTATGKLQKMTLRQQFHDYVLSTAAGAKVT